MEYISVKEAAKLWKIDISRVSRLAREGRIDGAKIVGRNWLIPKDSQKPADGRTRICKREERNTYFRFPFLMNREEKDFCPALSKEEKLLRDAELYYYDCEFDKAKTTFESLLKDVDSIHIKITILFYLCSMSAEVYEGKEFKTYYNQLQIILAGDFPNKKEMELVLPLLNTVLGLYQKTSSSLNFDVTYQYSESVLPLISYLTLYHLSNQIEDKPNINFLDSYELLCRQIEDNGAYYETCEFHLAMFILYYVLVNEKKMLYHLRKGLNLALEHNLSLIPACYFTYYPDAFQKIFNEYSEEYVNKIQYNASIINKSYSKFTENNDITKVYSRLSSSDYRYVLYAVNGLSNKQVADICKLSERTVANKYNDIYNKLGVNSKQELVNEMSISLSKII